MKIQNSESAKRIKNYGDILRCKVASEMRREKEASVRTWTDTAITSAEIKACMDELQEKLKTNKNERYEKIFETFSAAYEPVKDHKFLPKASVYKKFLDAIGECEDLDPNSLKAIKEKCDSIKEEVERRESYVKNREKSLRLRV